MMSPAFFVFLRSILACVLFQWLRLVASFTRYHTWSEYTYNCTCYYLLLLLCWAAQEQKQTEIMPINSSLPPWSSWAERWQRRPPSSSPGPRASWQSAKRIPSFLLQLLLYDSAPLYTAVTITTAVTALWRAVTSTRQTNEQINVCVGCQKAILVAKAAMFHQLLCMYIAIAVTFFIRVIQVLCRCVW